MATYAVGDIQGCYDELRRLLDQVHFDPSNDELWVVGDIVNRGPQSLAALRFIYELKSSAKVVLGNHDLHLLAVAYHVHPLHKSDTLQPILTAPDATTLLEWLRHQPLMHHDQTHNWVMVHAGIAPQWSLQEAQGYAREVEQALQSHCFIDLLSMMYGNEPTAWCDQLTGISRLRTIINYFTRMRCINEKGELNLSNKELPEKGDTPWFSYPERKTKNDKIIFGHWSMLDGHTNHPNTIALDTGCVWGGKLTLFCLESQRFWQEPSSRT